jgi:hypothetical protein
MSGDAGQLARDRTINVLHNIEICGEEDVKVALMDLERHLVQ